MSKKERKAEIRGLIREIVDDAIENERSSTRRMIDHLFEEVESIRKYVNDAHETLLALNGRMGRIEGRIDILVKILIPMIGGLLSAIAALLLKIAFGI